MTRRPGIPLGSQAIAVSPRAGRTKPLPWRVDEQLILDLGFEPCSPGATRGVLTRRTAASNELLLTVVKELQDARPVTYQARAQE